jgi:hypothetical protein
MMSVRSEIPFRTAHEFVRAREIERLGIERYS